MADPKLYISVFNDGTNDLYIKDAEARADIEDIKSSITGAMHYLGASSTAIAEGDATGPWTIDGVVYIASGTPASGQKLLQAGDVATYNNGTKELEFVWSGAAGNWREYGSTGSLKALAFKDSATGSVTAAGSNADSTVTFANGTGSDFVTGFNDDAVAPSFTEGAFDAGSLPSFTEGAFTPASLAEGFYSAGAAPSFTEGAFDAGSLPSFTEGTFSQGTLPSMTYDSANEKLTFAAGTLPTKAADTFSAGSLPTKAADSFNAGTMASLDLTKFNGGSKANDTFSAGSLPTKAADSFDAGSAATPTTAKALTASDTGTAAGQTFTGSAVSVTVS